MIFSSRIESLKRVSCDDNARKSRIRVLLLIRSLILWGVLPVVLVFFLFATLLEISFVAMKDGRIEPADFMKMKDIIGGAAVILIVVTFASLYLVNDADRSMRHLASLRDLEIQPKTEKPEDAAAPESDTGLTPPEAPLSSSPREQGIL